MCNIIKCIICFVLLKVIHCNIVSNNDIAAINYIIDFNQCIQLCDLNKDDTYKECKLKCYIDFGSIGYKNNFSFGVAPDRLMADINQSVKNLNLNDNTNSQNDDNTVKHFSVSMDIKSLTNKLQQKYIKSIDSINENILFTKESLLEMFNDDSYLLSALNNISNNTYHTLRQLTRNINDSKKINSNIVDTLTHVAVNNKFIKLFGEALNNLNGSRSITKELINNVKNDFSENECLSRCDISTKHLRSVFDNTNDIFNEDVIDEDSINDIYQHCINQCKYINQVYETYSNITVNGVMTQHINNNVSSNMLNKRDNRCNSNINCVKNKNNILECSYSDNNLFFNRIDGCSIPGIVNWSFAYDQTVLLPSCNGHDACYHCNPTDTDINSNNESITTNEYLTCNKMLRENGEKACDNYNFGSVFDTIKGRIKCYQEVETMVLAVDVAGWKSYSDDRNYTNNDKTGCLCNPSVRQISGQNFIVKK
ncbi:hypothetical protein PIROE2DRAFT_1856 [Piromyces sp. E2]|nr:hypothetical protein PIROE2DRAFT_1856 [Piromyces sp. E2]|eukprot:OUM70161.1 hypothetical protein PIROE2DRAFT_1856 [Piromyces sp. E2]